jgi:folate-binding protein YgfZ
MVAELRLLPLPGDEERFLMDLPAAGFEEALAHLRRFLPPRFASLEEVSGQSVLLAALGPAAPALLSTALGAVTAEELRALEEGDLLGLPFPGRTELVVLRSGEVATPAWELLVPAASAAAVEQALLDGGIQRASEETWDTLRLEAGRPAYGSDMDAGTIPVEAGIGGRVVDYAKGCFTGQEVLIRIRDRGHVNRHLRGLRLGALEVPPAPGTPLFRPGEEKAVGQVTSSAPSPRFGEVIGLGYVRREVAPPAQLRLGGPEGTPLGVHDLETDWRP